MSLSSALISRVSCSSRDMSFSSPYEPYSFSTYTGAFWEGGGGVDVGEEATPKMGLKCSGCY